MTSTALAAHRVDGRSVGELLLEADARSRTLLWESDRSNATPAMRTIGEVIDAAAQVWATIPDQAADPTMARIHALATGIHRTHKHTSWPGPGPAEPTLERIATTLTRAAELISARRHPTAALSPGGHADSEAARTRIMHIVHVSVHALTLNLTHYVAALQQRLDTGRPIRAGESLRHARHARDRLAAIEHLTSSYLQTRWPGALTGEHRPAAVPDRLEHAIAQWELATHTVLARQPRLADMYAITGTQTGLTLAAEALDAAAATCGLLDPHHHRTRQGPALARLGQAWTCLGDDLRALLGRHRPIDPDLLHAANALRAALRDITHDGAGAATPETIAARLDLTATSRSLHKAIAPSADLAHRLSEALHHQDLTAPARTTHTYLTRADTHPSRTPAQDDRAEKTNDTDAGLDPRALHHNRDLPLPERARTHLLAHTEQILTTALAAASITAAASPPPASTPPPTASVGRALQDRTPPALGRPLHIPGHGCER